MDPCVMMIARKDPFVRSLCAGKGCDHVVDGPVFIRELDVHADHRASGPDVIRDRKRSTPIFGCNGAAELFEQGLGVGI